MSKVTAFFAEGTEEVECLAVVDVLLRAGIEVQLVSISGKREVTGSHKITVVADKTYEEAEFDDSDMLFLPGGMPGVVNLTAHKALAELLLRFDREGKRLAAVCAAPSVLGGLGILNGKKATCFPGWEDKLQGAICTGAGVVTDGNVSTGRGLGFSIDLGLEMIRLLEGDAKAADIKSRIQHPDSI